MRPHPQSSEQCFPRRKCEHRDVKNKGGKVNPSRNRRFSCVVWQRTLSVGTELVTYLQKEIAREWTNKQPRSLGLWLSSSKEGKSLYRRLGFFPTSETDYLAWRPYQALPAEEGALRDSDATGFHPQNTRVWSSSQTMQPCNPITIEANYEDLVDEQNQATSAKKPTGLHVHGAVRRTVWEFLGNTSRDWQNLEVLCFGMGALDHCLDPQWQAFWQRPKTKLTHLHIRTYPYSGALCDTFTRAFVSGAPRLVHFTVHLDADVGWCQNQHPKTDRWLLDTKPENLQPLFDRITSFHLIIGATDSESNVEPNDVQTFVDRWLINNQKLKTVEFTLDEQCNVNVIGLPTLSATPPTAYFDFVIHTELREYTHATKTYANALTWCCAMAAHTTGRLTLNVTFWWFDFLQQTYYTKGVQRTLGAVFATNTANASQSLRVAVRSLANPTPDALQKAKTKLATWVKSQDVAGWNVYLDTEEITSTLRQTSSRKRQKTSETI